MLRRFVISRGRIGGAAFLLHILALLRRPVTYMHCAAGMPHLLSIPIECTNPTRRVWGFGNRPIFVCGQMHYFPPLVRPKENSSALQGRWPEGPEGFPMHKSNFSLFSRPVYVVRGCVRCCSRGRETPPPLRGSSPCRRDSFAIRMANKRVVTTPKSECHEMPVKTDKLCCFG